MEHLTHVELTDHQRRVGVAIVGEWTHIDEIQRMIGQDAVIARSFMKKLEARLSGSWWRLERRGLNEYAIFKRTVKDGV